MGNLRRVKKSLNKAVPMTKTGVTFEGSEVVLAGQVREKAKRFKMFTHYLISRSKIATYKNILAMSFVMRKRLLNGEPIWN